MKRIKAKERIAIYFYFDRNGDVDRYPIYFLNGLKKVADRIIVVVNGLLTKDGRKKFESITKEIIVRKNEGLDVAAYKEAFKYVGWDKLSEYEEVIYCNSTIMGPIYPFSEMFNKMNEQDDLDFWGITYHPDLEKLNDRDVVSSLNPYGYIPKHIQHYFVVYRKQFTKSKDLQDFWENLPAINSYNESVALFETVFTKHFTDLGYKWSVYLNYTKTEEDTNYILMHEPLKAVSKYRCPVFKRKIFFLDRERVHINSIGERIPKFLEYLEYNHLFDTSIIFENIIKNYELCDIISNLNFRYVLNENIYETKKKKDILNKTLIVAFTENDKNNTVSKLKSILPKEANLKIVNVCYKNKNIYQDIKKALLKINSKYKYICVYNDYEIKEYLNTAQKSSRDIEFESVLGSEKLVSNIVNTMENNEYLAMLIPETAFTSNVVYNKKDMKKIINISNKMIKKFNIKVPFTNRLIVPQNGYFWIKKEALDEILKYDFSSFKLNLYFDMAFKNILPYLVQENGYLTGYITTNKVAAHQLASADYYKNYMKNNILQ